MLLLIWSSAEVPSGTFRHDVIEYMLSRVNLWKVPVLDRVRISLLDDFDVVLRYQ